jgi:hypothetical protein
MVGFWWCKRLKWGMNGVVILLVCFFEVLVNYGDEVCRIFGEMARHPFAKI